MKNRLLYEAPEVEVLFVKIEKRVLDPSIVYSSQGTVPEPGLNDIGEEY